MPSEKEIAAAIATLLGPFFQRSFEAGVEMGRQAEIARREQVREHAREVAQRGAGTPRLEL